MMNKLNYINIGDNGTFKESGQVKSFPEDVDLIFEHLRNNEIRNITVHVHGGLVNEKSGMAVAKMMTPVYSEVGSHPITFVWESGLFETIEDRIMTIHKTKIFKWILKKAAKVVAKKYGLSIDGKGGNDIKDIDIEKELEKEEPFAFLDAMDEGTRGGLFYNSIEELEMDKLSFENEIRKEAQNDPEFEELIASDTDGILLFSEDIKNDINDEASRGWGTLLVTLGKVTWRIVKRFVQKRDHGGMATIFEELLRELYIDDLGAWVWDGMKLKAKEMWNSNTGLSGDNLHAGRYFFGQLEDYINENPSTKVNLVGHSAGAIVICHFLNLVVSENRNCSFETISFLAPACKVELFNSHIVDNSSKFKRFRMFTMSDHYETRDHLLGKIYPRSLLYLISGFLENGYDEYILGLERHIEAVKPYNKPELQKANEFIYSPSEERIVFSVTNTTAPNGKRSESKKHGDFDNDPATQQSLQTIIR
ncbi:hypothetical protein Q4Q39_04900 [Flavivirga amylovorans]|uniref:Alpha/beta hydrolase n=1 Tax=Flavivirga amylovorans TaxID=870486 RepID=A0ABT8WYH0_9FLAO|nr:hypothetical protein [Flavivirga amylovorans]MDO5986741.1 hypothetical protein [Flavivirga amylovorans]